MFLAPNGTQVPRGFAIDPNQAVALAKTAPKMIAIHRTHHPLRDRPLRVGASHYEIYFYYHGKVIADQLIGPRGQIGATYTGPLILGIYGRGHYGQIFDSPLVLVPFTADVPAAAAAAPRRARGSTGSTSLRCSTFGVSYAAVRQRPPRAGRCGRSIRR